MREISLVVRVVLAGLAGLAAVAGVAAQEVFKDRLVVIQQPDRPVRVLRVAELRMEPEFAITFNQDGNRGAWQREYVLGHGPVCTEVLLKGDDEGLAQAVRELEALAGKAGGDVGMVDEEMYKARQEIKQRAERKEKEKEARLAAVREGLQEIRKIPYAPEKEYPIQQLEGVVGRIQGLYEQGSEIRGEIDEVLRPWKTHLEMLQAGKVWRDGAWVVEGEYMVRRQAQARAAREAYLTGLRIGLPAEALPDAQVKILLGLAGAGLLASVLLLLLLVRDSSRGNLTLTQAAVLIGLLLMLGGYGYVVFAAMTGPKNLAGWSESYLTGNFQVADSELGWALARAGGVYDQAVAPGSKLLLKAADINALLAQQAHAEEKECLWKAEALAVAFTSKRVRLVQQTRLLGAPILLEFDMGHTQQEKVTDFGDLRFFLGTWQMPSALGAYLLKHTGAQLMKTVGGTRLLDHYRVVEIGNEGMVLVHDDDLVNVTDPAAAAEPGKEKPADHNGSAGSGAPTGE